MLENVAGFVVGLAGEDKLNPHGLLILFVGVTVALVLHRGGSLGIQQLENTNKSLEIVTAQNKKQDDRLTALEKAPGVFGNKLWWAVIAAFVSGFVAYELTALLH